MRAAAANTTAKDTGSNRSTVVAGDMSLPTINVVVPGTTPIYMNPNSLTLSVDLNGSIDADEDTAQIVSEEAYIENRSEVPVSVTVALTGAVDYSSNMRLSSSTTKDTGTTAKKAFVFFQMQAVTDPDNATWNKEYNASTDIVLGTNTKTRKNYITIAAPDTETGKDTKCYGVFRLTGDCTEKPKIAWDNSDGFSAQIVFTFKALAYNTQVN
jgi:hypothetical protein